MTNQHISPQKLDAFLNIRSINNEESIRPIFHFEGNYYGTRTLRLDSTAFPARWQTRKQPPELDTTTQSSKVKLHAIVAT